LQRRSPCEEGMSPTLRLKARTEHSAFEGDVVLG
jgi:hypothetical protein